MRIIIHDTQHNNTTIMLSAIVVSVVLYFIRLSVIMLSVVAPDQNPWGLYYKTFYGRNLRIFIIS